MENAQRWRLGSPPVLILARMAVTTSKEPAQTPAELSGPHVAICVRSFLLLLKVSLYVLRSSDPLTS